MNRFIYIERDDLSNRGCNRGVEVYKLNPRGFPVFIGGNYNLNSGGWVVIIPKLD